MTFLRETYNLYVFQSFFIIIIKIPIVRNIIINDNVNDNINDNIISIIIIIIDTLFCHMRIMLKLMSEKRLLSCPNRGEVGGRDVANSGHA